MHQMQHVFSNPKLPLRLYLHECLTGVGGVHRGGENSMDISADLVELGRTPMAGKRSNNNNIHTV